MRTSATSYRHYILTLMTIFGLMVPTNAVDTIKIKDLSQTIPLAAGEKLDLNRDWIKYSSQKVLKQVSSYPFLEHKKLKGLMGTLNTEVKFYNTKKEGNLSQWFKKQCKKLEEFYPQGHSKIRYEANKVLCIVELLPTKQSKGMIQYMKVKSIKKEKDKTKVFVYTYNFFTPMKDNKNKDHWDEMKASVTKLMEANL